MKNHMKFFLGIILSVFCFFDAYAATKTCPAGLFCTSGGKYTFNGAKDDIQTYMLDPAEQILDGWGVWSDQGLCDSCAKSRSGCTYCANEYDEAWVSTYFGFYFIKNGEAIYHSSMSGHNGVFPCPGTYPSSAEGASSVFECYRVVSNGQKEYYKPKNTSVSNYGNCDMESVAILVADLQQSLNEVNNAVQALQNALTNSKKTNNSVATAKALINAGMSESVMKVQNKKETTKMSAGSSVLNNKRIKN